MSDSAQDKKGKYFNALQNMALHFTGEAGTYGLFERMKI